MREDASKLFRIGSDNLYLYMRSDNKKGVKIFSLEDGTKVSENNSIHNNPMLNLIIMKDNKHIISGGKDKKVKIYNWVNDIIVKTLSSHTDNISSLVLSED